jgi:hypothetical protein
MNDLKPMEKMTFNCSWGRATRWITGCVFCLIAFEAVLFSLLGFSDSENPEGRFWPYGAIVSGCLAILVIPAFFAPLKYYMTPETMGVSRIGPDIVIRLDEVESLQSAKASDFTLTLRVFGSGGLYGNFGLFRNAQLGLFRACMTRREPLVVVRMKTGKPIVLSPDAPDAFIQSFDAFRKRMGTTDPEVRKHDVA